MMDRKREAVIIAAYGLCHPDWSVGCIINLEQVRRTQGITVLLACIKKYFEHPSIDGKMVKKVFEEEVVPWCKENGLKLLILDNESKFHTKMLVTFMKSKGIQIYPGSGKKPWGRAENGYPPRSHDCIPDETEFAETFQDAQEDLERREKNRNKRRTMMMWKDALDETWRNRPIEATRKIIDRQPKIMQAIREADSVLRS